MPLSGFTEVDYFRIECCDFLKVYKRQHSAFILAVPFAMRVLVAVLKALLDRPNSHSEVRSVSPAFVCCPGETVRNFYTLRFSAHPKQCLSCSVKVVRHRNHAMQQFDLQLAIREKDAPNKGHLLREFLKIGVYH